MGCGALSLHFWGIFHRENVNFFAVAECTETVWGKFSQGGDNIS